MHVQFSCTYRDIFPAQDTFVGIACHAHDARRHKSKLLHAISVPSLCFSDQGGAGYLYLCTVSVYRQYSNHWGNLEVASSLNTCTWTCAFHPNLYSTIYTCMYICVYIMYRLPPIVARLKLAMSGSHKKIMWSQHFANVLIFMHV